MEDQTKHDSPEGLGIWEHFTVRDGLPDMKIECIFEDSRGVLWIGTHDRGVVRYDGDEFEAYSRREGLCGDGVFSVLEDREGNLWFGTNGGLTRFDGRKFEGVDPGEACSFLWGSCIDKEGNLWFGMERRPGQPVAVCRWDGTELRLINLSDESEPQGQSIHKVVNDEEGVLWFGGSVLYRSIDGAYFEQVEEPEENLSYIAGLLPWMDGSLWIAAETGLWSYNGDNLSLITDGIRPISLLNDPSGICWATTYDGRLLCYDGSSFNFVHNLNTVVRGGLCLDKAGRLWIGTYGMGLYYYDTTRVRIFQKRQGLPSNPINCLTEDSEGTLWIGTKKGLASYDGSTFSILQKKEVFNDEVSGILIDSRKRLWISIIGEESNFWIYNQKELVPCPTVSDLIGYRVSSLVEDQDGKVWFSFRYGQGFGYYDKESVNYFSPTDSAAYPTWIGDLEIDHKGNLWIGSASSRDGLCYYDGASFKQVDWISGCSILALYEDREKRLWIGTNEGLSCYDGNNVVSFGHADGLSYEIVTSISQAEDGTIWIGTEGGGVGCYDGKVLQTIQIPQMPECNIIHDILQDSSGRLWFATEGGLIRYIPRRVPPRIEITEIIADDRYAEQEEVQFPNTVGRISIGFGGKSPLEHSSHLVYRYRLQGYDRDWRQTRERLVHYPKLEPGEYTFAVQAVDRDLNYSAAAEVKLIVTADPRIEALNEALRSETKRGEFTGDSFALRRIKKQIQEVAWTDLTVLVLGETGTGKGLAARAIYELSKRKDKPFIHVNCGAMPEGLADSELFGHERGAFTSAVVRKLGKFELADGGTIFLDEIGDLPPEPQTRLLHVLQDHCIERVGGTQSIDIDVRVIAATNRDLNQTVRNERFRADLYYRLNVFPIQIPPLRERKEDIPALALYFVRQFSTHLQKRPPQISEEVMQMLFAYEWPGNVRELEHTLQRAVLLAGKSEVRPEHIVLGPAPAALPAVESMAKTEDSQIVPLEEYERRYLSWVLEYTGGVIHGQQGAAHLLDVKPTTLRSRLEKLGIKSIKKRKN